MSTYRKQLSASPEVVASGWLERRLFALFKNADQRARRYITVMMLAISLISYIGTFSYFSTSGSWSTSNSLKVAALAAIVSLLSTSLLYPVLRLRDRWLLRAVSTISHDNLDLLSLLGKLTELRDAETAGHNLRVTVYTLLFAEALGFSPVEIVRAAKGALLHDIGKLTVPDRILQKPGPLTPDERAEMNLHVRYGLEIVSQCHFLFEARPVVAAHHERYDGRGYPLGLKAEAIPREARLFAVVDVFDALTSTRIYKPAYGIEQALAIMAEGRGSHFDPDMFDRFEQLASTFVTQLPESNASLTQLLMARLLPYLDRLVFFKS
jgi:putative nucleotidyltransferase with HDIG domain